MKKYSCHDKHYKVILFQAAVITLLFHMAMLYSFVYKPPQNTTVKNHGKQIVMFNLNSQNSAQSRGIAKWLEYHSPSLIARPDAVNGYGAASIRPKMRAPVNGLQVKPQPAPVMPVSQKFEFLSGGNKLKVDKSSRLVGYETLAVRSLPATVSPSATKISYPLLKLSTGKYIAGILTAEDLKPYKLTLETPVGVTQLQIALPAADMMPRIKIKNSCGIAELDHMAVRKLLLNRETLNLAVQSTGGRLLANIIWREVKR
ncbi:MAG: hypothetical protein L3J71_07090 [Victivallaceae bacterium]|nr:hypothetical protein [Victivallaceae bacterium]